MSDDLVKRYRKMQEAVGGCFDGHCVIKKPSGMHTNGGCTCLMHLKLHEASRVGQLLKYSQQMADRIEELEARTEAAEAKLAKAVEHIEWFISEDETNRGDFPMPDRGGRTWNEINAYWLEHLDAAIAFVAELKGKTDE